MKFFPLFDRYLSRASGFASFWPLLPASIVAVITGYLSSSISWINGFGLFGWWAAGLIGFLISALSLLALAAVWERLQTASAISKWKRQVDNINPLESEFTKKRILLRDLRHPAHSFVNNKVFTDCELVGPSTIVLMSGSYSNIGFINCDLIAIKDDQFLYTPLGFQNCSIRGGQIMNATIYVHQGIYETLKTMPGIVFINEIPDEFK